MQAYNENISSQKLIPGAKKYPPKVNKMFAALVEYLESLWYDGSFERTYVSAAEGVPASVVVTASCDVAPVPSERVLVSADRQPAFSTGVPDFPGGVQRHPEEMAA